MPTWSQMLAWGVPGLLALGALAWLAWALFADRSRGRARCPKCAYDMAGAGGLTCPECGRTVRTARGLYRTRRRWRQAACAVLLLAMAYPARVAIHAQQVGWPRALPSIVLVEVAPLDKASLPTRLMASLREEATPVHPLTVELCRRAKAGELSMGQWRRALGRVQRTRPDLVAFDNRDVRTRQTWSRDVEVRVAFRPSLPILHALGDSPTGFPVYHLRVIGSTHPGVIHDFRRDGWFTMALLGPVPEGESGQIDIALYMTGTQDLTVEDLEGMTPILRWPGWRTFDIVETAEQVMLPCAPVASSETLEARLTLDAGSQTLSLMLDQIPRPHDCALGGGAALWRRDTLIATGEVDLFAAQMQRFRLEWTDGPVPLDIDAAPWRVTFRGDPRLAIGNVTTSHYLAGEVEFRVTEPAVPWSRPR